MNVMRVFGVVGVSLGLAVVACGGDSDSGSGSGGIAVEELPAKYAAATCAAFTGCLGVLGDVFLAGSDCATRFSRQFEDGGFNALKDGIAAGRIKYDGTKVQACLDSISKRTCESLDQRDAPECTAAVEGTIAAGGDCSIDAECKSGHYCKGGGACPGKCTAREAANAACEKDDHCQNGLKCGAGGSCEKPADIGEACENGAPDCRTGLLCLGGDAEQNRPGTCKTQPEALSVAVGGTCDLDTGTLCQGFKPCELTVQGTTPSFKCAEPVAAGADCKLAFPDQCPEDQYCAGVDIAQQRFTGKCQALPKDGEDCATAFGKSCGPYATCINGKCRELQRVGGSCTSNDGCYSDKCSAQGKCVEGLACNR